MADGLSGEQERFGLSSERLGCLPVLSHFLARMGFDERLRDYLPADDPRLRISPGAVCGVVVRNIVVGHRPLYALAEWAVAYDQALLGLPPGSAGALNDDRVGRSLDRLFDADRASLLTETVLGVVDTFGIDCSELHNDSTTVTVTGAGYGDAAPASRGGVAAPVVTFGHNKDFRPDLLTELRGTFFLVRGSQTVAGWVRVLAHGHRQRRGAPGSRLAHGALGGIAGLDWRPVRALSAA